MLSDGGGDVAITQNSDDTQQSPIWVLGVGCCWHLNQRQHPTKPCLWVCWFGHVVVGCCWHLNQTTPNKALLVGLLVW